MSVRLSVRLSIKRGICDKTKDAQIFILYEKNIYRSFLEKESLVHGATPSFLKYWVKLIQLERNLSASAVTPNKKFILLTLIVYACSNEPKANIVRCSKVPKRWLKNAKQPFPV